MSNSLQYDIFLSHNSQDKAQIEQLATWLRGHGIKVWFDAWQLRPGQPWQEGIEGGIKQSNTIGVFLGASGFGQWEVPEMRAAINQNIRYKKPIIPILLPGCDEIPELPIFLQAYTWVDFRTGFDDENAQQQLLWAITGNNPYNGSTAPPPKSNNLNFLTRLIRQPLSPLTWALLSLVSFIIGTALLMLFIFKAGALISLGINDKIFYVLLIPLGLSASAFFFGAMRSLSSYKGKTVSRIWQLIGPVIIFVLVLLGGFKLIPDTSTFNLTVFVHGSKGKQDIILKDQGEVIMDLEGDRRTEKIGPDGRVHFLQIPARLRHQPVPIIVIASGFEMTNPHALWPLTGKSIYLTVKRDNSLAQVCGRVTDENLNFLTGAQIRIGDLDTTTDEVGWFLLKIQAEKQKEQQTLVVYKDGYEIYQDFVYPGTKAEVHVILQRSKK